ncbi:MAG: hypothetical protein AAF614_38730 [Chloroflexota bacterium]
MSQDSCTNCGNSMLPGDTVCWHCGQTRTVSAPTPKTKAKENAVEPLPFSPTAVLAYGALTLAIFIALITVMRSLSQQPLIAINSSRDRDRSWSVVTDRQQQFTLELPSEWQWSEPGDPDFESQLAAYEGWETAVSPLDPAAIQLIAVVPETERSPTKLIVVARNIQLHALSYAQIQQLIEQQGFSVAEVEEHTSFFGSRQIELRLEAETMNCAQQYTLEPENSYLFSICTQSNFFLRQTRSIQAIQDGFQTLQRN